MLAKDVMTTAILTVTPETDIGEIAQTLLNAHISAVPVIGEDGNLLGIVSEGDLIHRVESDTRRRQSWWLRLFDTPEEPAQRFLREYGRRACDVMTKDVITVSPDTSLTEIAAVLEKYHIKRVPVIEGGKLVGIVSRANLLRGIATWQRPTGVRVEDSALRAVLLEALGVAELPMHLVNVTVTGGEVEIWGVVDSDLQIQAARAAVEATAGVIKLTNHLICRG